MSIQHTPGPWFTEHLSTIGHCAIVDANGFTIANPSPMGTANARLIVAAPDMLHALQRARRILAAHAIEFDCDGAIDAIDAAIARATGV